MVIYVLLYYYKLILDKVFDRSDNSERKVKRLL